MNSTILGDLSEFSFHSFKGSIESREQQGISEEEELKALHNLNDNLDLPQAIATQLSAPLDRLGYFEDISENRFWAKIVIELYANLLVEISEQERAGAIKYVDSAEGQYRLSRMLMLIWLTPDKAPAVVARLAETPDIWLNLHKYSERVEATKEIRDCLHDFGHYLKQIHSIIPNHIETVMERCEQELAKIGLGIDS
jgi:hypothetical protein